MKQQNKIQDTIGLLQTAVQMNPNNVSIMKQIARSL